MTLRIILNLFVCYLFVGLNSSIGQIQSTADSLKFLLHNAKLDDYSKLEVIEEISNNEINPSESEDFADLLIAESKKLNSEEYLIKGYILKGTAKREQSDFEDALESYFFALNLIGNKSNLLSEGQLKISIADVYSVSGNHHNAVKYYNSAIVDLTKISDLNSLATAHNNLGDEYFLAENFDAALKNFDKAGMIFKELKYPTGISFYHGNTGMVYAKIGQHILAEKNMNMAISSFEEMSNYYPISVFLTYIADIYVDKKDLPKALNYANRSLVLAKQYGLKNEISNGHKKLTEIHEHFGNHSKAHYHYKEHIAMRDSINDIETVEALANQRTEYEVSQKQQELDLADQKRKTQRAISIGIGIGAALLSILALLLFRSNRFEKRTNKIIAEERDRSDNLLLNILPAETAEELKANGKVKAKKYNSVSVMFADFVGFTNFSKNLNPEEVVECIDSYFTKFDAIVEGHRLEKIKTIGDGYMCAGGLPLESKDHAKRLILAAQEMKQFVKQRADDNTSLGAFDFRIGIHSGPVVAGVVGSKKFAYDIWGDTVNTAARMEAHSNPGKINISAVTYELVKDQFVCLPRNSVEVKGKGVMDMFFVEESKHNTF